MAQPSSVPVGPIPLMVALWDAPHFTRTKRTIIASLKDGHLYEKENPNLDYIHYNDKTQAIGIHAGPQFARGYTVSFFEDADYHGRELCLGPGVYPTLNGFGFGGVISSLRFNEPFTRPVGLYENGENVLGGLISDNLPPALQIPSIPLVVRLLDSDDTGARDTGSSPKPFPYCSGNTSYPEEMWRWLTLVQDAPDFRNMFGREYDATTRQVILQKGPDYDKGRKGFEARLYDGPTGNDPDQPANLDFGPNDDSQGPSNTMIPIAQGNWPSIYTDPWNFDRRARALRIVEGD